MPKQNRSYSLINRLSGPQRAYIAHHPEVLQEFLRERLERAVEARNDGMIRTFLYADPQTNLTSDANQMPPNLAVERAEQSYIAQMVHIAAGEASHTDSQVFSELVSAYDYALYTMGGKHSGMRQSSQEYAEYFRQAMKTALHDFLADKSQDILAFRAAGTQGRNGRSLG